MRDSQPKIIIIGVKTEAIERVSRKLIESGFTHVQPEPVTKAAQRRNNSAQIAIFLPGVPKDTRNRVAHRLRRQNPALKIVMLYEEAITGTELANAVINVGCEPEDLARVIHYLARKRVHEAAHGA